MKSAAGRLLGGLAASVAGQNPVTNVVYNPYGTPPQTTVTFGSSDSDVFNYDANTGRMAQYQFNVNGQSDTGALSWNANSTLRQLAISDALPSSTDSQTCNYTHDDLTRIASANCGTAANQTFSYDPFGNISKSGSPYSFQPTYSETTNRITMTGYTYDANGNVLTDPAHSYAWDADGNSVTVDGVGVTYDALDRAVEQNKSGVYAQMVYTPGGDKLAIMSGQTTLQKAFVALPGQATAIYTSTGLDHYRHSDWLGNARLTSTPAHAVSTVAYAPFGETYAQSGTADPSFTGMNQDTTSGDYDFPAREYNSVQGRWASPDPAGIGAVNPMAPQSWNRYAYVLNNPLGYTDPTGLDCVYLNDAGTGIAEDGVDNNSSSGECGGTGGYWIDGTISQMYIDPNSNWVSLVGVTTDTNGNLVYSPWTSVCNGTCSNNPSSDLTILSTLNTTPPFLPQIKDQPLNSGAQTVLGAVAQQTKGVNTAVTCASSVVLPFLGPNPDDVNGLLLDDAAGGAELAANAAGNAAGQIKQASRLGPSRLARIAKLEGEAAMASRAAMVLKFAGFALAVPQAYNNFKQNCIP